MSPDAPIDERTLRTIIEAAPDGIVVIDAGGRIRVVNAQLERLFGYSREELIGERVERSCRRRCAATTAAIARATQPRWRRARWGPASS